MSVNRWLNISVAFLVLASGWLACANVAAAIEAAPKAVPKVTPNAEKSDAKPPASAAKSGSAEMPEKNMLSKADREKIRRVITLQLRAFERDEAAIAFSYATADTRKYFGSPRQFMEMVRGGYPPLIKHNSRKFLEAAIVDGLTIQPVKFVTADGDIVIALYTMEHQADSNWRIGGCELAPSSLQVT